MFNLRRPSGDDVSSSFLESPLSSTTPSLLVHILRNLYEETTYPRVISYFTYIASYYRISKAAETVSTTTLHCQKDSPGPRRQQIIGPATRIGALEVPLLDLGPFPRRKEGKASPLATRHSSHHNVLTTYLKVLYLIHISQFEFHNFTISQSCVTSCPTKWR